MKTYLKTHPNKQALQTHIKKITAKGGTIVSNKNGTIEYGFPATTINKKYTHFAVKKSNNKILTAWEYAGYPQEDLNSDKEHYFWGDLKNLEISKNDVSIQTKAYLIRKGINPFDQDNWSNS